MVPRSHRLRPRPGRSLALIVAASTLALLHQTDARAQGFQDVSLSWARVQGAESCIGAHELAQAVQQRIGHDVFLATGDAQLSVEGYVQPRAENGFEAMVVTSNPEGQILGQRQLTTESNDCRQLDEPLALVIALTIDPESGFVPLPSLIEDTDEDDVASLLDAPTPADDGPPTGERDAARTQPLPPPDQNTAARQQRPADDGELSRGAERLRGFYSMLMVAGGYAPDANGGLGVGYMGSRTGIRAGAESRIWLPRPDALGTGDYLFSAVDFSLYGCPLWRRAQNKDIGGQLCAGLTPGLSVIRERNQGREVRGSFQVDVAARVLLHTPSRVTPFAAATLGFLLYGVGVKEQSGSNASELWTPPAVRGGAAFGLVFER